jgi:outer membrane protein OmpA-like peptidoglycan-associated protein
MHSLRAAIAPLALILATQAPLAASAQTAPSNPDVVPAPVTPGNGVLLYPGGEYGRVVHPLLQPGTPYPGSKQAKLHLHMPVKHVAKAVAPAAPATAVASTDSTAPSTTAPATVPDTAPPPAVTEAPPPPPPPPPVAAKPAPRPAKVASAPRPPAPQPTATDSNFASNAVPFSLQPGMPQDTQAAPQTHVAKASPPPAQTGSDLAPGLAKQMQIIFAPSAPDPSADSVDAIKGLAGPLNTALLAGASRIQVVAYGGPRGDKSSDSRRLSLKRARVIRQLLIDGGVPAERIDVRAMGGTTDGGAADRVDILTKT